MRVTASFITCLAVFGLAGAGCGGSEPCPVAPVASAPPPPPMASAAPPPPAPAPAPAPAAPPPAAPAMPTDSLAGEPAAAAIGNDVAGALANIMATTAEAMPAAWSGRVGSPSDAFKAKWKKLLPDDKGDLVATLLDVGAVTTGAPPRAEMQAKLIVMPDGRVRYSTIAAREGKSVDASPTPSLATSEPGVATLLDQLVARLVTGPCQVPVLTGEDLLALPAPLRGELGADFPTTAAACSAMRSHKGDTWGPVLEAAVVVLKHADTYVAVAAHFQADTESGKLVLQPVDVAPVTGKSMELGWASEGPPTPKAKPAAPAPAAAPPAKK